MCQVSTLSFHGGTGYHGHRFLGFSEHWGKTPNSDGLPCLHEHDHKLTYPVSFSHIVIHLCEYPRLICKFHCTPMLQQNIAFNPFSNLIIGYSCPMLRKSHFQEWSNLLNIYSVVLRKTHNSIVILGSHPLWCPEGSPFSVGICGCETRGHIPHVWHELLIVGKGLRLNFGQDGGGYLRLASQPRWEQFPMETISHTCGSRPKDRNFCFKAATIRSRLANVSKQGAWACSVGIYM